jgi:hypothetical protein
MLILRMLLVEVARFMRQRLGKITAIRNNRSLILYFPLPALIHVNQPKSHIASRAWLPVAVFLDDAVL